MPILKEKALPRLSIEKLGILGNIDSYNSLSSESLKKLNKNYFGCGSNF
jgi:hypothetical protein